MLPMAEIFKFVLRVLVAAGFIAALLFALFVAWWIAVVAVLGFVLYAAVRRLLPRKAQAAQRGAGGAAVIEGEFRIEREEPPRAGER